MERSIANISICKYCIHIYCNHNKNCCCTIVSFTATKKKKKEDDKPIKTIYN